MFRIKASETHSRIPLTAAILLIALAMAFVLSASAVFQVLEEYNLLSNWLTRQGPVSPSEIDSLRDEIGARIIVRSSATAVLVLCTVATLWLQQRQLAIRRTLQQIKLLACDILSSMDQGVITTDLKGRITSVNSAATQILGVESECVERPLAEVSPAGVSFVSLAKLVAERNEAVWDQDFDVERVGRVRRIRVHVHVLKDGAGAALGCLFLIRDVSERVLMEERVRRMEHFLVLGSLASGLHHEIKNPLTALSLHIQLLDERLAAQAAPAGTEELIGVVKSELCRLNGVLERFRNFANLQRLTVRPTDVLGQLAELVRLIAPQAAQQGVEIVLRPPAGGLPLVPLDAEKFKQAVLNLVINALEAMSRGGVLTLRVSASGGEFQVEVTDTGSGIAAEIQGELFKPYFSTKTQGTGMGLALTAKLIGQHEGSVTYRTGPGGTTFVLRVPTKQSVASDGQP